MNTFKLNCNDGKIREFKETTDPAGSDCWSETTCLTCGKQVEYHTGVDKNEQLKEHQC